MLPRLVIEMAYPDGTWEEVAEFVTGAPPGSISNNASGNREVIRFRWDGDVGVIERSEAGADFLEAQETVRRIVTEGWERIAALRPGEQYELLLRTDTMKKVTRSRFRYESR